jgi:16S rRNA (uracil1498-N3)-methyltransferase
MRLFFDPNINDNGTHMMSTEESKHIIRVLRMDAGDTIGILDGKGTQYICEISNPNAKKCAVEIKEKQFFPAPNLSIHIAVGPTKQMDRLEWFLEKATEIGITEITLFKSDNSERVKINEDRLQKKLISAMKQSQRFYLPKLNPLISLKELLKTHPNGLIAHCYNGGKEGIANYHSQLNGPVLIGPEGDFSEAEVQLALDHGYKAITLGDNRLRTETAALYACMQLKFLSEL